VGWVKKTTAGGWYHCGKNPGALYPRDYVYNSVPNITNPEKNGQVCHSAGEKKPQFITSAK
jgi:hypothetical protein